MMVHVAEIPAMKNGQVKVRQTFLNHLKSSEFRNLMEQSDGGDTTKAHSIAAAFHDVLLFAEKNGWVHYTRLANKTLMSPSQVNRWFKKTGTTSVSTPNRLVRVTAIDKLAEIIEHDIKLIESGNEPIGGLKAD